MKYRTCPSRPAELPPNMADDDVDSGKKLGLTSRVTLQSVNRAQGSGSLTDYLLNSVCVSVSSQNFCLFKIA